MRVRRISYPDDLAEIRRWWTAQGRAVLSENILPVLGFICEDDKEKIAVSWLYCSDGKTGFVSWTTVNPDSNKRIVSEALTLLGVAVEESAKVANMRVLFQFSGGGGFSRKLIRSGWKNTMIKHDFLMKEM